MPENSFDFLLQGNTRKTLRDNLIMEFLKEEPGNGKGDLSTVYYYYVDSTSKGVDIYLKRPAFFNKGMDFEVHAEGDDILFENMNQKGKVIKRTRPSHETILNDLESKKEEKPDEYANAKQLIDRIYQCEEVQAEEMNALQFNTGHDIELILKIIKWLFIEQDITYWNWSGRAMFYAGINEI